METYQDKVEQKISEIQDRLAIPIKNMGQLIIKMENAEGNCPEEVPEKWIQEYNDLLSNIGKELVEYIDSYKKIPIKTDKRYDGNGKKSWISIDEEGVMGSHEPKIPIYESTVPVTSGKDKIWITVKATSEDSLRESVKKIKGLCFTKTVN